MANSRARCCCCRSVSYLFCVNFVIISMRWWVISDGMSDELMQVKIATSQSRSAISVYTAILVGGAIHVSVRSARLRIILVFRAQIEKYNLFFSSIIIFYFVLHFQWDEQMFDRKFCCFLYYFLLLLSFFFCVFVRQNYHMNHKKFIMTRSSEPPRHSLEFIHFSSLIITSSGIFGTRII